MSASAPAPASSGRLRTRSQSCGFSISSSPGPSSGVVLALRIALPLLRHQDPPQVGMIHDIDAELVVDLALQPVGGGPELRHRLDRILLADPHLDAQPVPEPGRVQAVDHVEALLARRPVGGGHVRAVVEQGRGVVLEEPHHVEKPIHGDDDRPVADPVGDLLNRARYAALNGGHRLRQLHAVRRGLILGGLGGLRRRLRLRLGPRLGRGLPGRSLGGGLGGCGGLTGGGRGLLRDLRPGLRGLRPGIGAVPPRLRLGFVRHLSDPACRQAQSRAPLRHA